MKTLKHTFVFLLIILVTVYVGNFLEPNNTVFITIQVLIVGFVIFNLMIRKSLFYKRYFTSQYNLFTSKFRSEKTYDIPKELLFEKVIEVVEHSQFKLQDTDSTKFEILASSKTTFKSWGENLYISFETKGNETLMKFCSATFFQMYSWGKNEKNYDNLIDEIEKSFII